MNWAAFLSFLHPMLVCIICGIWILFILKRDYSEKIINRVKNEVKNTD